MLVYFRDDYVDIKLFCVFVCLLLFLFFLLTAFLYSTKARSQCAADPTFTPKINDYSLKLAAKKEVKDKQQLASILGEYYCYIGQ